MKPILLVSEFFPPEPGGIQRSLALLTDAWGDDVRVITPVLQKKYPGLRRSLFSGRVRPRWAWLLGEFWRQASGQRRLIVFGHYSAAVMAAWLLRPVGVRYVILAHGNDVLSELARPNGRWVARHFRDAEWVGVNSSWLREKIQALGVAHHKIIITHPAVADNEVQGTADNRCEGMVITIARLVPRKNIATVLQAIAQVVPKIPKLHYHIIGDGPEREKLQALAQELNLSDHVVWHGHATDQERQALLQRAQVFALVPTIREAGADIEGLGAVYLEAAAAHVPVIASPTGGVPDAVRDGQTGRLVDPNSVDAVAQAIEELLTNANLREKLGQAGQALMRQEFTASRRTDRARRMIESWPVTEQPKISVIIPVYNARRTIGRTLASLHEQTWKNLEIIVVDDGSNDDLAAALAPWRDHVTLVTQTNAGAPAARNRGAAAATGTWWLFLDADTVMHPNMLMTMATMLHVHPEVAYVYSDFKFGVKNFHLREFSGEQLQKLNYIHTSSLVRPAAFPGFDPKLKRFQDWDVWLTMLRQKQIGLWIPRLLFSVSDTGIMSRWLPSFVYQLPLIGQGKGSATIASYREAERVIRTKHHLT